ncbi:MAG: hypothetical protein KGL37_04165 [Acidobacteriota bacterium]|nr:hypothetical protein [Acidobacteriota bacterium]
MKDIVISWQRILRESQIFIGCLLAALAVNAYSIVRFKTHWTELFTTFHITLAIAAIFFVLLALVRGIVLGGRQILRRKAG